MTTDELARIGRALYGERWQSAMARDLDVVHSTVWRWTRDTSKMREETKQLLRLKVEVRRKSRADKTSISKA